MTVVHVPIANTEILLLREESFNSSAESRVLAYEELTSATASSLPISTAQLVASKARSMESGPGIARFSAADVASLETSTQEHLEHYYASSGADAFWPRNPPHQLESIVRQAYIEAIELAGLPVRVRLAGESFEYLGAMKPIRLYTMNSGDEFYATILTNPEAVVVLIVTPPFPHAAPLPAGSVSAPTLDTGNYIIASPATVSSFVTSHSPTPRTRQLADSLVCVEISERSPYSP